VEARLPGVWSLRFVELGAHVAALGIRFYTGQMFPQTYQNQIFIAEHGSWNRSTPVGYRVTLVDLEDNRAVKYEPFATGWLIGRFKWGRPVDVLVMPDGALLGVRRFRRRYIPNHISTVVPEFRESLKHVRFVPSPQN